MTEREIRKDRLVCLFPFAIGLLVFLFLAPLEYGPRGIFWPFMIIPFGFIVWMVEDA